MTFQELINLTKVYARDTDSRIFSDANIKMFLNQGVDRIKQYNVFHDMATLTNLDDIPNLLPSAYHYLLALFASSRLFDTDERFFEGTEKRNEFEYTFRELIDDIESGTLVITDELGVAIENTLNAIDFVKDTYFDTVGADDESAVIE